MLFVDFRRPLLLLVFDPAILGGYISEDEEKAEAEEEEEEEEDIEIDYSSFPNEDTRGRKKLCRWCSVCCSLLDTKSRVIFF